MTDFFEILKKRRSVRDFLDREVPTDLIMDIIKDTCQAPSSGNGQPWRFIIIKNREMIKRLSDESKANLVAFIEKNPNSSVKKYEAVLRDKDFNVFYNTPCLVYIVAHQDVRSLQLDCSLAAAYFMFSAVARGLGTTWVDLGSNVRSPEILKEIGLPDGYRIVAPLILGYPRIVPAPPEREAQLLKIID